MTANLVAASEDAKAGEAEAKFARMREAIEDKKSEIAEAEANLATLVTEDAKLCADINENRRVAALPEPEAGAFATLEEWHAAARKWRADRAALDEELGPLERARTNKIGKQIPTAQGKVGALRRELRALEIELAWAEYKVAEQHAVALKIRAHRLEYGVATAAA